MNTPQDGTSMDNDKLIEEIKHYGWTVILVEATYYLPSFTYTIGLWKTYNHPELISFGKKANILHSILNTSGEVKRWAGTAD